MYLNLNTVYIQKLEIMLFQTNICLFQTVKYLLWEAFKGKAAIVH